MDNGNSTSDNPYEPSKKARGLKYGRLKQVQHVVAGSPLFLKAMRSNNLLITGIIGGCNIMFKHFQYEFSSILAAP